MAEPAGSPGRLAEPSVSNALRQGWEALTRNLWTLIGITLVYVLAQAVSSSLQVTTGPGDPLAALDAVLATANGLYSILVLAPLTVGVYFAFLRAVRGEEPRFGDLLEGFSSYLNVVAGMFLTTLAIAVGFVFLVVPGLILLVRLSFTPLLLVDKRMGPIEALKESWEQTRGHGWSLFGLLLVAIGILLLGIIALFVGVFVAIPWVVGAYAAYYHDVMDRPTTPAEGRPGAPAGAVGA